MIKPVNVTRHELIGLKCEALLRAGDKKFSGRLVDETRSTFMIMTEKGKKMLIKEKYDFVFALPEGSVKVSGDSLIGRPRERIKKKIDKW
ncbi:MAG: ribonuclease P protein subunit [Candidatus Aenigmarchaeota archaeon]|nr:ribonuclease P protein subunit [Candidatus Aenigmarchaeota archaeon]